MLDPNALIEPGRGLGGIPLGCDTAENMIARPGLPGAGIETTEWASAGEPDDDARVVQLFVHELDD